jgi:endonuclease/exonuclease/phosphatase family metal-dependent hydrolase
MNGARLLLTALGLALVLGLLAVPAPRVLAVPDGDDPDGCAGEDAEIVTPAISLQGLHVRGFGAQSMSRCPSGLVGEESAGRVARRSTSWGEFVLATFNVLGHSHTAPGGGRPGWAPSRKRMRWTVRLLDRYSVDVAGLQELQPPQKRRLVALAGDRYDVYSSRRDTDNSIAWRRERWERVAAGTFRVPYFEGKPRRMPVVRLRDKATGRHRIFINVHNPADTRRHPNQDRFRDEAVRREYRMAQDLATRHGVPVFLLGDFNERAEVFCELTQSRLLHAAAGGSHWEVCEPPDYTGIDWIFGTTDMEFSDHIALRTRLVRRTSDHPLVLTRVHRWR